MTSTKTGIIEKILAMTEVEPTKYFDKLSDKPEPHLRQLIKVIKILKKNAV